MSSSTNEDFEVLRKRLGVPAWVEPGWQRIVVEAVERIEWLLARDALTKIEWSEIKTWHGTLAMRFRFACANDEQVVMRLVEDVVTAAKMRAGKTCMVCGSETVAEFVKDGEQLRVLCVTHRYQRDAHKLSAEQVVELVKPKVNAISAAPIRKRSWRVIGSGPAEVSIWTEDMPETDRDTADVVEYGEQRDRLLWRERARARHRASEELVREAIADELERIESGYGIAEIREGARQGEWVVSKTNGATTNEEIWLENEGMEAEWEVRTPSVRLVQVRD